MAASSVSLWAVLSNLFLLSASGVLVWKGYLHRFPVQIGWSLVTIWFSSLYHACYQSDIAYCPDESPGIAQQRDILATFLMIAFTISIFVRCWMGKTAYTAYLLVLLPVTSISVTMWQDDVPSILLLVLLSGGTFFALLYIEFMRIRASGPVQGWWWLRFFLMSFCMGLTAVCYGVSYAYSFGSDDNIQWHSGWHMAASLASFWAYTLLPLSSEVGTEHVLSSSPSSVLPSSFSPPVVSKPPPPPPLPPRKQSSSSVASKTTSYTPVSRSEISSLPRLPFF